MSKTGKLLEILNDIGNCGIGADMLKVYEQKTDRLSALIKNGILTDRPAVGINVVPTAGTTAVPIAGMTAGIIVRVADEKGRPVLCEVRVNADGRNGFWTRRFMTGDDGKVSITLPAAYMEAGCAVSASKGPEYSEDMCTVEFADCGEVITLSLTIKRLIDMKKRGYLCGDIHHHSIYSSPVYGGSDDVTEMPEEVARSMKAAGLDFGALSDHHNILGHERWRKTAAADFIPIISKEISTSNGHVMALGAAEDVIYEIPQEDMRTDERLRNEFIRITCHIHDCEGLAQLNHPTDRNASISWNRNFDDIIQIFDTMEVWNGSNPMMADTTNGRAFAMWMELMYRGIFLPATTGSDTHNIHADDYNDMITAIQNDGELSDIFGGALSYVKKWASRYLSSGCVRTYVRLNPDRIQKGLISHEEIIMALKAGDSFITNGPLIYEEDCKEDGGNGGRYIIYNKNGIKELRLYYSEKEYDVIPVNGTEYTFKADDADHGNVGEKKYRVLYVAATEYEFAVKYIG